MAAGLAEVEVEVGLAVDAVIVLTVDVVATLTGEALDVTLTEAVADETGVEVPVVLPLVSKVMRAEPPQFS